MSTFRMTTSRARVVAVVACVGFASVMAACGGSGNGGTDNDSPTSTVRTKNAALNNCVSVMSGERPAAGVTIPRCVPTTIAGTPNKKK